MLNFGRRARVAVTSSMLLAWAFLAYACTVEDENPGSTRTRDGGSDTGSTTDGQNNTDGPLGAPICGKYGGYEKVKQITAAIVARVSQDCRISAPIANLDANQTQHLAECFQIQIGGAFQCPGISYVSNTTKDSKGEPCRDMSRAHRGLNLRNADFNAFVEDVAAELAVQGVSADDIRAIAPVFEGTRTGVVQTNNQPDKNTFCTCPNGEYMGKACVVDGGVVDTGIVDTGADTADAADQ
jgi:hypothetical protein